MSTKKIKANRRSSYGKVNIFLQYLTILHYFSWQYTISPTVKPIYFFPIFPWFSLNLTKSYVSTSSVFWFIPISYRNFRLLRLFILIQSFLLLTIVLFSFNLYNVWSFLSINLWTCFCKNREFEKRNSSLFVFIRPPGCIRYYGQVLCIYR